MLRKRLVPAREGGRDHIPYTHVKVPILECDFGAGIPIMAMSN
jgi:hypothetical protein